MDPAKYVIIEWQGHEVGIIFSHLIPHKKMGGGRARSAGFCGIHEGRIHTWGDSESLGTNGVPLASRPQDAKILNKLLDPFLET